MDLNQAAVFVKVVQAGSFIAAARLLGLPVSTVSYRVAMLEKRLNVTLLQRTTRRLNLTEAGELYFRHASAGLGHLSDAEAAVMAATGRPGGLLRVTAPADLGDFIIASLMTRMRQMHPEVQLEFVLMDRYADLFSEGIDVAIRAGKLKDSTLIARSIGIARWAAFASPDYLRTAPPLKVPQELQQHCCLQFTARPGERGLDFLSGQKAGLGANVGSGDGQRRADCSFIGDGGCGRSLVAELSVPGGLGRRDVRKTAQGTARLACQSRSAAYRISAPALPHTKIASIH